MWSAIICFYLNMIPVALVLIIYWVKYLSWELLLCEINHNFTTEKEFKTLFLLDMTDTKKARFKTYFLWNN